MPEFNGPDLIITLDDPTVGVLNVSVETDLYSKWKEWTLGNYSFDTELDVNSGTEQITIIDHSLHTEQEVTYTTGGSENIGLVNDTEYYVNRIDRNNFQLYDTPANALAGGATGRQDLTASGGGSGEDHFLSADNAKFPAAFRTIGGDPLSPGLEAGGYFFLQNQDIPASTPNPARDGWRIISTLETQTINYAGNLIGEDASEQLIVVTPGFTVLHLGLQPVTQRVDEILTTAQLAVYGGCVYIDTINGTAGTLYPSGTPSAPTLTLADGLVIAATLKLTQLCVRGSIQLTGALTRFTVNGIGSEDEDIIDINGQDVSGSRYQNIRVIGDVDTLTAPLELNSCRLGLITDYQGTMTNCGLEDTITLAAGQTNVVNCYGAAPTGDVAGFDFQATNLIDLFVRGMTGEFSILNSTNASSVASIDMTSGNLTIDADWVSGTIAVRGVGTYTNNSALTINDKGLIDSEDMLIIKQMVAGNVVISLDDLTITVYDEDDVTVLATFSVSADGRVRTRTS